MPDSTGIIAETWHAPDSPVAAWWRSLAGRGRYAHAVIVGPRKCGKSTWFATLEERSPDAVQVWNVRPLARAESTGQVWASLFGRLGVAADLAADPVDVLDAYLDDRESGVTLVVDDWDAAVDGRGAAVSDACYEVLDTLARHCLEQAVQRPSGACLGLVLVTSLPDVIDLEHFARAVQRPTFEKLSMLITRSFQAHRFPLLGRGGARAVLAGEGVPGHLVDAVATDCGGWLWLLLEAAQVAVRVQRWSDRERIEISDQRIPVMLHASLLRYLADRPPVQMFGRDPMTYLMQELARHRDPRAFGLPTDFDDESKLAPLFDRLFRRTFLVVDTENVRIPFQHHAEVYPELYPEGIDAFLRHHVGQWLERLQDETGTAPADTWLIGRSTGRIDATVGSQTPGMRLFLPARNLEKKNREERKRPRESDSTDDALLTGLLSQHVERHPLARFILVSGDADAPLLLDCLGAIEPVTVYTPWRAGDSLKRLLPADRIREDSFPLPRPPEVSPSELSRARQLRRSGTANAAQGVKAAGECSG